MSVVWQAQDLVLGRAVAVKVLDPVGPVRGEGIQAEALAAARLAHPHVASVFDYGELVEESGEQVPYVVMEFLDGTPLARLAATGPLPPAQALRICAQVADGLAAAHAGGLVHCNVKPGNVMITAAGAKIFDFGIAGLIGTVAPDDEPRRPIVGTAAYLAPERLVGAELAPAADVYSLGVMLYQLLTHDFPWSARTSAEMVCAHAFVEPADLPPRTGVPAGIAELYQRCLAKDPALRPSAREVAARLSAAVGLTSGARLAALARPDVTVWDLPRIPAGPTTAVRHPARVAGTGSAGTRTRDRRRRALAGAAASLLLVGGVFVLALAGGAAGRADPSAAGGVTPQEEALAPPAARPTAPATRPATPKATATTSIPTTPTPTATAARTGAQTGAGAPVGRSTPRTFTTAGGSATAVCFGSRPVLTAWSAAPGFRVKEVRERVAGEPEVTFQNKGTDVSITVTCDTGTPVGTVTGKS